MDYSVVSEFTDLHDLIKNRVCICNQLLGSKYDASLSNPLVMRCRHGVYSVLMYGCDIATFKAYDLQSTRIAYERIDALSDGLWYLDSQKPH